MDFDVKTPRKSEVRYVMNRISLHLHKANTVDFGDNDSQLNDTLVTEINFRHTILLTNSLRAVSFIGPGVPAGLMPDEDSTVSDKQCHVITTLCFVNLVANTAYSSIAPFFPNEAKSKGLDPVYVGFIFAGYSLSMFLFAPLYGSLLTRYGRKNVLILGCLCEGTAIFCFGLIAIIQNPNTYGWMAFLCRAMEGFGNGCLNSSSSSIIAYSYESQMSKLLGLTQTFTGLGMLTGPLVGSLLFQIGGFQLPFFFTSFFLFLLILPITLNLQNDKQEV